MLRTGLFAVVSLLLMASPGCTSPSGGGLPGIRTVEVKPRQPQTTDRWCVYTTTAAHDDGAIPAGGDICLLCTPGQGQCDGAIRTIDVGGGIVYNVAVGGGTCGACPATSLSNNWTYERR